MVTLSVSPQVGNFIWSNLENDQLGTEYTLSPKLAVNPTSETSKTYRATRDDGETDEITITYKPRPSFTVTFDLSGGAGTEPSPQLILKDSLAKEPPSAGITKVGYTFEKWNFNFNTPIIANITISAKWKINTYTVSFAGDGILSGSVQSQTINYNELATAPDPPPSRTGYDFEYWELAGSQFAFTTPITSNLELKAKWKPQKKEVSFEGISEKQTVDFNGNANPPKANPTKVGFTFEKWNFNFATPIVKDTLVKANWSPNEYTINFDSEGGTPAQTNRKVIYGEAIGTLPIPTKNYYEFKGWFTEKDGQVTQIFDYNTYSVAGNTTFYAKWEFVKGGRPTAALLNGAIPPGLKYNALPIAPILISQKAGITGTLGTITTLYNGSQTPPTNAGTYSIGAFIAKSPTGDYDSATVALGSLIIGKADITLSITSASAENKVYDGTTVAVATVNFNSLLVNDVVSRGDYSLKANFATANAGNDIAINGTVSWNPSSLLYNNYNLQTLQFGTEIGAVANITRAIGILEITAPKLYELSNPTMPSIKQKNNFVRDEDVIFEYKKEGGEYSSHLPNRIGNWSVRATLAETGNYSGAADSANFEVARGNATTIIHNISFSSVGFAEDSVFLNGADKGDGENENSNLTYKLKKYFVAGSSSPLCQTKRADSTEIFVTVKEPDIILKIGNVPQKSEVNADGFDVYSIPFGFGKPGLDTLIYSLLSRDGIYAESDTLLIETPLQFESVIGQKWNNVLYVNNNSLKNGGYKFTEFEWFKNGISSGISQFYSAGKTATDILNAADTYKTTMFYYGVGDSKMRISTCEGNSIVKDNEPLLQKILSKSYTVKGEVVKEKAFGVYFEK
ncbi:hypothetical protein AGMMS49938_16620 [Fibrobacterales bacterium]|nr:hypothetical protein AGMMS49938_16620 [Fibrobacterales bacterium]